MMNVTVSDVMRYTREFFATGSAEGRWALADGILSPALFAPGDWIAIEGGNAPAGVYQFDENGALPIEGEFTWQGCIHHLSPPRDFLRLCAEIDAFARQHPDPTLTSEHFGAYSRTQSASGWQAAFADALRPYIRMYSEVNR